MHSLGSLRGSALPLKCQHGCPNARSLAKKLQLSVSAVSRVRRPAANDSLAANELTGAAQLLERSFEVTAVQPLPTDAVVSPTTPLRQSAGKREIILVLEGETLESTPEQTAIVFSGLLMTGALLAQGVSHVHDAPSAAAAVAAFGSAYLFADFASGVYHWSVDNYGSSETPVFGSQIAGFQAHHQRPWTITEREFANNVHKVFKPALPFAGACLAASPWLPGWACIWLATATTAELLSQQFHAWAHMKKSELHPAVITLQEAGLLISRKAHGAHHKAPFEGNYCIVSGFWNPLLDQEGRDDGFFRQLERLVHATTGAEPRCWHAPQYEWKEDSDRPE